MNKTFQKILASILISGLIIGIIFYFFLFLNPIGIHASNTLKWIPLLIVMIIFYIGGRINKNTSLIWWPILLVPLILFKPFNFIYFPFVIILILTSILMLLVTRAEQNKRYRILGWVGVGLIFMFYLLNQPMIIEKEGFGYDEKGNLVNAKVLWDFSSKEALRLPNHILADKDKNDVNLANLKEHTYFVSFWATWCGPCMEKKPALNELKKQLQTNSEIKFVDISFDTNHDQWKKYLKNKNPIGLQLISKNSQATSRELNFAGIPMYFIVEKDGIYKAYRSFDITKNIILQKRK